MTSLGSVTRAICVSLLLIGWSAHGAQSRVGARDRDWVTTVVTKISEADRRSASGVRTGGNVSIRVRIEADGALADVGVDVGSGSASLDRRAIQAVRAAAPFRPPPAKLLTLEGFTELSFALQLDGATAR